MKSIVPKQIWKPKRGTLWAEVLDYPRHEHDGDLVRVRKFIPGEQNACPSGQRQRFVGQADLKVKTLTADYVLHIDSTQRDDTPTFAACVCDSPEQIPSWVSSDLRQQLTDSLVDPHQSGSVCIILRNGEVVHFWEDTNAPEDNTYSRNFNWIVEELERAFEAGKKAR